MTGTQGQPSGAVESAARAYHVQYTVWYDPLRSAAGPGSQRLAQRHLRYHTLDASACQLEWNIPAACPWRFKHAGLVPGSGQLPHRSLRGSGRYYPFDFLMDPLQKLPSTCISVMSWHLTWQYDGEVVFGKGHLHIGGIDLTLYRETEEDHRELLCRTTAGYGSGWPNELREETPTAGRQPWDQPAGNEEGYVVEVSTCQEAFPLRRGDRLVVEARYRAAPWFEGVMGLLDLAVAPVDNTLQAHPRPWGIS